MTADKPQAGSTINKRIVFIGAGNMAEALISGLVKSALVRAGDITATDLRPERLEYIGKKYGIRTGADNISAVKNGDIVFLAVKPQGMEAALSGISAAVTPSHLIISIAAGITTSYIERFLPKGTPVIRTMPNTPALLGAGAVGLSAGRAAAPDQVKEAVRLFSTVGAVVELPEKDLNAVTALSGSGPAYVFYMAEALEQAGKEMGLPEAVASLLARQTIFGAGTMLSELPLPAGTLRKNVTSPGGTTEAALASLQKKNFIDTVKEAVKQARKRADELQK